MDTSHCSNIKESYMLQPCISLVTYKKYLNYCIFKKFQIFFLKNEIVVQTIYATFPLFAARFKSRPSSQIQVQVLYQILPDLEVCRCNRVDRSFFLLLKIFLSINTIKCYSYTFVFIVSDCHALLYVAFNLVSLIVII